ncbi:small ribosomal subunit protein mS80 (rPPR6) [Malania oleifera]|uniref:small ribosomal subunit protein mS80 (rPPR6) n=1 Tax=Malania oleifera TaxID=397392 RepID=UPI0025AE8EF4|nr:small ribosomal subunit protein mS80 (rPPR6) [Malania oleifera]
MWRSIVARKLFLSRLALRNPSQVPHKTLNSVSYSNPPRSSSHLCHDSVSLSKPRYFSQVSTELTDLGSDALNESHNESPMPDTSVGSSSDTVNGFDVNPSFASSDLERSSVIFDENLDNGDAQMGSVALDDEKNEVEIDMEKLENALSLLQSSVEGSLGSSLEEMGLTLHEEFVLRILETPLIPGENLLGFFKWALRNPEFLMTTKALEALVGAITSGLRKKDAYAMWDLVKEIGEREKGVLSAEILNKLIALFSKLGKGKAGFEVFNKFEEFGCVPNVETYFFTIEALCRRSFFDWAWSVCEKMLNMECLPDSEEVGKIISWFCKGSRSKEAYSVYLFAKEKKKFPPQRSVNFLIGTLCREDDSVHLAVGMLEDFSGEVRKYAIKPFSSVIRGLCRIKDVEGAKKLLLKMIDAGPPPGNAVFSSVINTLSKSGDMEEARMMMKLMESRGLKPDVYTYTVIMSGYASGGQMDEACRVLSEVKKKHSKLSPVTYHTLIRGFCRLEEFDKALVLLDEMKDYGVHPNADEYGKLIQSLCLKSLDWKTAERLLEEMKGKGLYLNGITRGLIRAVKELEEEELKAGESSIQI